MLRQVELFSYIFIGLTYSKSTILPVRPVAGLVFRLHSWVLWVSENLPNVPPILDLRLHHVTHSIKFGRKKKHFPNIPLDPVRREISPSGPILRLCGLARRDDLRKNISLNLPRRGHRLLRTCTRRNIAEDDSSRVQSRSCVHEVHQMWPQTSDLQRTSTETYRKVEKSGVTKSKVKMRRSSQDHKGKSANGNFKR